MPSNHAQVGEGFRILQTSLAPYIARELQARYKNAWWNQVYYTLPEQTRFKLPKDGDASVLAEDVDAAGLINLIDRLWGEAFITVLPKMARTHAIELKEHRNKWAHVGGSDFTADDAYRALDTMTRFLETFDNPASKKTRELAQAVQRAIAAAAEPAVVQTPAPAPVAPPPAASAAGATAPKAESKPQAKPTRPAQVALGLGVRPWREVIQPHQDVAQGKYQTAEFAADLADVLAGKAEPDYQDPTQFFARTFLTEGMRRLLAGALRRMGGAGGDPVIQLKTAFGGGKTHTMLALFHVLKAGAAAADLPGMEPVLAEAGVDPAALPPAKVAVLVGTDLDPSRARADAAGNGVVVRTLWGEMAAQLGGAAAYEIVKPADLAGVAPGAATLVDLFTTFGPVVVLIDEFVAYARNIYTKDNLPAGTFDSNTTFIQSLTEAAKRSRNALVIASIPESDKEMGGEAGREAQARLEQIFGRVETV